MATNITAEFHGKGRDGSGATVQKAAISIADQVVNTTPNSTGGWNTATVTADNARTLNLTRATHGVPNGVYEKSAPGVFRLNNN